MGIQELNRENPVRGSKVKAPPAESSTKNDSLRNWTGLRRKATFLGGNQQKEGGGGEPGGPSVFTKLVMMISLTTQEEDSLSKEETCT